MQTFLCDFRDIYDEGCYSGSDRSREGDVRMFDFPRGKRVVGSAIAGLVVLMVFSVLNASANGDYVEADAGEDITILETDPVADFDGSGSSAYPNDIAEYAWVFGDGSDAGYGETISHEYWADDGEYLVYLIVSDTEGNMDDDMSTVTVENVDPEVWAGRDVEIFEGYYAIFNGQFNDTAKDTHEIRWEFGDGSNSTGSNYTWHRYTDQGTYEVTLTVTDDDGGVGMDSLYVTVINRPPYARLWWADSYYEEPVIDEGDTLNFYAQYYDSGWTDDLTIELDYGDGSPIEEWEDTYYGWELMHHVYEDDGFYNITLTVTDEDGAVGTDTMMVEVHNVAPTVELGGPYMTTTEGACNYFDATMIDPGADDTHTIEWDFGDGTTASGSLALYHRYTENGVYNVTLNVTDDDGGFGSDTMIIAVDNVAPRVYLLWDQTVDEGDVVEFKAYYCDPGIDDTHILVWDFGDGTVITDDDPDSTDIYCSSVCTFAAEDLEDEDNDLNDCQCSYSCCHVVTIEHTYVDDGDFMVTLTVLDDDGDWGSDTCEVTVENVAPEVDAGEAMAIYEGGYAIFQGSFEDPGANDTHTIEWDFGDGTSGSGALYTWHRYMDEGEYTVTLTVTDDDGGVGTDTLTLWVQNRAPWAYLYGIVYTENGYGYYSYYAEPTVDEGEPLDFYVYYYDYGWNDTLEVTLDFGDGTASLSWTDDYYGYFVMNHTYMDDGEYTMTLTVEDSDGGVGTDTMLVTVENVAPQIGDDDEYEGLEGEFLTFEAEVTDQGDDELTYEWEFGDGETGTGMPVTHAYGDNGVYTLTLTVTDDDGGSDSESWPVTITNADPVADAGYYYVYTTPGETVEFEGSITDPGWLDTHSVNWNFADGTEENDTLTPEHAFDDIGYYLVWLTVTDDDGGVGTDYIYVIVRQEGPYAYLYWDQTVDEGEMANFYAYGYNPINQGDLEMEVDFGDGSAPVEWTGTYYAWKMLNHTYGDDGNYTVTLTVTDEEGDETTDTVLVTVLNVDPDVECDSYLETTDEAHYVWFEATIDDPGWEDTHTIVWDFGDGTFWNDTLTPWHRYGDNGIYNVTVTVTDDDGGSDSDTVMVSVSNVDPYVWAYYDVTVNESEVATFYGVFYDPGYLDTHTFIWEFGDGTSIVTTNYTEYWNVVGLSIMNHSYDDDGTYYVNVTVFDDDGGSNTDTVEVTVLNLPPDVEAGADITTYEGYYVRFNGSYMDPSPEDTHTVEWEFGDGTNGSGTLTPYHWYYEEGEYDVNLTVTDDDGGVGEDSLVVTVLNRAPYAYLYYPRYDDLNVTFYLYYYDPGRDDLEITLDYGDGTEESWSDTYYHWEQVTHTYEESGTYTITMTVEDDDGASTTVTLSVTVEGPDPPDDP